MVKGNSKSLLAGLVLVRSYAAPEPRLRDRPSGFVKDTALTMKIKSKLAAGHLTRAAHIHVDTDVDGIVWLSGTARSEPDVERAVSIARGTEHLVSVKNDLTVKKDD